MKVTLPQRYPCLSAAADWSACIAQLDNLLAALRAWQPRELPPSPPTEQDRAAFAAFHSGSTVIAPGYSGGRPPLEGDADVSDEQFGFDIEFDEKTEAFLAWAAPERMQAGVRLFLSDTIPGIADYSADTWWKPPMLTEILTAAHQLFDNHAAFTAPENQDRADQFVRFLGECCIRRHPGMTWTNSPEFAGELYPEFGPAVHFAETGNGCDLVLLVDELFRENYGPDMVEYEIRKAGKPA